MAIKVEVKQQPLQTFTPSQMLYRANTNRFYLDCDRNLVFVPKRFSFTKGFHIYHVNEDNGFDSPDMSSLGDLSWKGPYVEVDVEIKVS